MTTEAYLVAKVHEALVHDPRTAEAGVEVTVSDGKAYLSGTVATEERRAAVGEVATAVLPEGFEVHNETAVYSLEDPTTMESLS
jgi:hypothetical protein